MSVEKFDKKEVQESLLATLISSPDLFSECESIFNSKHFGIGLNKAASFIQKYFDEFGALPQPFQIKQETGVNLKLLEVTDDVRQWFKNDFEKFAKYRSIFGAIQDSLEDIKNGNNERVFERVMKASEVQLIREAGHDYFNDIEERVKDMLNSPPVISTGWKNVDKKLNGGIARGEIILFAGGSGVGKSFTLANLSVNFLEQQKNVLFLSLELSKARVAQRFDQIFTGIGNVEWRFKTEEVIRGVKRAGQELGNLHIEKLSVGTKPREMKSYLKNFKLRNGYYPDLFVVDYLDEMMPNEQVSIDNISERDHRCTSQLRQVGEDFDMAVATASQLNREAVEAPVLNHSHIAGGLGKIKVSDAAIAIRMDESQKHRGIMEFVFLKTRNSDGVYDQIHMQWVKENVRILDPKRKNDDSGLKFVRKEKKDDIGHSKDQAINSLFDQNSRKKPKL